MRRSLALGVVAGVLAFLVLDAFAVRFGLTAGIVPRSQTPIPWIVSRALGITAFVALTAQLVFGLASSSGAADGSIGRARAVDLHGWLSGITLLLVAGHVALLLFDGFAGFDLLDLSVPFVAAHRRAGVAFGIVSVYLAVAVHLSSIFRKAIGARAWRRLHYASFAVFGGTVAHGLAAGSDAGNPAMRALYVISAASVAILTAWRIVAKSGWSSRIVGGRSEGSGRSQRSR